MDGRRRDAIAKTMRGAISAEAQQAETLARATARRSMTGGAGAAVLVLRLLFNVQLIPMLAFMLIAAVATLLEVFFDVLSAPLRARAPGPVLAGLLVMLSAFATLRAVLRSFVYLAVDPFQAVEHAAFRGKVLRVGFGQTVLMAAVQAALGWALYVRAHESGWVLARHLGYLVQTALVQLVVAVASALMTGPSISTAVWTRLLTQGKLVGLACALLAGWHESTRVGSSAALQVATISVFAQCAAFAALWFGLETVLLVRYLVRSLSSADTWARLGVVAMVTAWAGSQLGAWTAPIVFVPSACATTWAYFHFIAAADAAAADAATGETAADDLAERGRGHGRASRDIERVSTIVKLAVTAILFGTALLLVVTAVQQWRDAPIAPVYTATRAGAVLRLTHAGFGHPQSESELTLGSGLGPSRPAASAPSAHAMCAIRVGAADLNIFDVGLFAQLAYIEPASADMATMLAALAPGWELRVAGNGTDGVWFYDFYSDARSLSVLAIRGTNPDVLQDLVQDLDVWHMALLLQIARALPTTLSLWPVDVLAELSRGVDALDQLFEPASTAGVRHYHEPVRAYAEQAARTRNVVLVGHSLGGGLSAIVGAQLGLRALSLSGPGLLLSRHKLGLTKAALQEHTIVLVPTNDVVPTIDLQTGTVIEFECPHDSPVVCHDPMMTLCHVHARCGSLMLNVTNCAFVPWQTA